MGEPSPARAEPLLRAERIVALDIIRGFALLGVLLMNNHDFFRGSSELYSFAPHPHAGVLDAVADWILTLFFQAKAVTLFSFLFGVGLAIQFERTAARGLQFGRFAVRRLAALVLIGVLHIALVWWGDILHIYALLGFFLLPFMRRAPRTLLVWGLIFLFGPWLIACGDILIDVARGTRPAPYDPGGAVAWYAESTIGHGAASWLASARFRLHDYLHHTTLARTLRFASYALGLFLLGLAAWKRGLLRHPERHLPVLRRIVAVALPLGLAITAASLVRWNLYPYNPSLLGRWLTTTRYAVGAPLLALGYAAGLLLLLQHAAWRARLAPLAPVGHMALTSYLLQSLVMTTLHEGFGLGLYGRLGSAAEAALCLALFAAQIVFARWWLHSHPYGPMEWVWRVLTYGRAALASPSAAAVATASPATVSRAK